MTRQPDTCGAVIRAARKAQSLTQQQLSQLITVSQPALSGWENGSSYPSVEHVTALSQVLKIDEHHLSSLIKSESICTQQHLHTLKALSVDDHREQIVLTAVHEARHTFGMQYNVDIVLPSILPLTILESEWAKSMQSGCQYRVYWFTDFLLQNLVWDPFGVMSNLESFLEQLRSIATRCANTEQPRAIEHYFCWSGTAFVDATDNTIRRLAKNIANFANTLDSIPLNTLLVDNSHKPDQTTNIASQVHSHILAHTLAHRDHTKPSDPLHGSRIIQQHARPICGNYWTNGDSVVQYSPIDPECNRPPVTYRVCSSIQNHLSESRNGESFAPVSSPLWVPVMQSELLKFHLSEIRVEVKNSANTSVLCESKREPCLP